MAKGMSLLEKEQRLNTLRDRALRGEITTDQYVARALGVMKAADRTAVEAAATNEPPPPTKPIDHNAAGR